jgi:membrane fusion protein (multidrug efflux system)
VSGAVRPNAVLLPQRAVQQGVKSHFVWTVDKDNKPRQRVVEMGEWQGDDCFINDGLRAGDRVVVDGALRLSPNAAISITGNASSVEHRAKVMPPVAQQQSEQNSAR